MTKHLLAWVFLGALANGLHGAENVTAAAGFAFPSIQDGGGARAIALGSAFVGIAEGSASLLWNPAGLGTLQDPEIALHHNAALVGSTQDIAVLGLPLGDNNGLGISLNYENDGTFDGRDLNGIDTGNYAARAFGGSVGWGIGLADGLNLGLSVKAEHEDLADTGLDAVSGDLGVLWNVAPALTLGAAYTNLGPSVNGWQLDQGLSIGMSSYFLRSDGNVWLAALSEQTLTAGETTVHLGLEDTLFSALSLRAGYAFSASNADADTSNLLGWTFGVGVLFRRMNIDYAYVPMSDLGATQRVSLSYQFGCHCLQVPLSAFIPNETLLSLNDDDFEEAAAPAHGEELTRPAKEHLYQALTQVSGVTGAVLKVSGESNALRHPGGAGNSAELRALGDSRAALVRAYVKKEMPRARVFSGLTQGSEKDTSASLFELVLR